MKNLKLKFFVLLLSSLFFSCLKVEEVAPARPTITTTTTETVHENCDVTDQKSCNETKSFTLLAGQTTDAGNLLVTNDKDFLYVTYKVYDNWNLDETHLYVGALENMPTNNANTPVPGHFPYSNTHPLGTKEYTYSIPLSSIGSDCYIIAAHSSVSMRDASGQATRQETAWSSGTQFPNTKRWGFYSDYCTQNCVEEIPTGDDGTDTDTGTGTDSDTGTETGTGTDTGTGTTDEEEEVIPVNTGYDPNNG